MTRLDVLERASEGAIRPSIVPALISHLGADADEIFQRAGLRADRFAPDSTTITVDEFFRLMAALDEVVSSPEGGPVAVRMAQAATLENLDPGLLAFFSSPDVATAMTRSVDVRALRSISWVSVESSASGLTVEHGWPEPLRPPPVVDLWWQLMATWLVRTGTKVRVVPTRVEIAHPVAYPQAYEEYLGISITEGTSNITEFSAADARLPLLTANDDVWQSFEPMLRKRLREFEFGLTTQEQVRSTLMEVLPTGEDSIEAVAHLLAVGARTLQRQLREEGTSYSEMLTDTRKRLADHYLQQGYLNNSAIARRLGYQDPRSFARAFQSWTGIPLKEAREKYETDGNASLGLNGPGS